MVLGLIEGSWHTGIILPQVGAVGDCELAVAIEMDRTAYGGHDKNWNHVPGEEWILLIIICS
jgi:hypothetical protein